MDRNHGGGASRVDAAQRTTEERLGALEDALVHLAEYNVNETCLECGLIKAMQREIATSESFLARRRARVRAEWAGSATKGHR